MTTTRADALYRAQHVHEMEGRNWAIHNPNNKPVEELPVIFGFNNGGSDSWYDAVLLAEDGTYLGGHVCSHECYMEHDLGILEGTRDDRHEGFRKHYPDGYRMAFVDPKDDRLQAAYRLNQAMIVSAIAGTEKP